MDLSLSDMLSMQTELWELHRNQWSPMEAAYGRNFLLWMVEEMGEAIAIIKKKGDSAIMDTPEVRSAFLEEMSDVLMYYCDTLLRYGVTAEELADAYQNKHAEDMGRDYEAQYRKMLTE